METRDHIAVFSDVHADVRALRSIIDEAHSRGIDRIWNLGDFATGGPDPADCVDLCLETCEVNLFGNHEFLITPQAWRRTSGPRPGILAAEFAYLELGGADQNTMEHIRQARRGVASLPHNRIVDLLGLRPHALSQSPAVELVHGSLLKPMDGFMRGDEVHESLARAQAPVVLCGHTHLPQCYLHDGDLVRPVDVYRATGKPFVLEAPLAILNPEPDATATAPAGSS
jgi:Calcineurin-like phosphoesterase superfamily domain